MNEKIYVIDRDQQLREMEARDYDDEDLLQTMLADHPDLLAGHQINEVEPRRWLLVAREMSVPDAEGGAGRWSLDHLFLDQDGIPTLVEVKRASDTRIRREVVGQMLDYAANALLHWPVEVIQDSFSATCEANHANPAVAISDLLNLDGVDEDEVESYWTAVADNLSLGRLRLVFLADRIPAELRRIIEFLNEQMPKVEVLGVELRQFVNADLRALVPRVIGQTTAAESVKRPREKGRQWDEPSFFADMVERCTTEDVETARAIMRWARRQGYRDWWGKGKRDGSYIPVYEAPDGKSLSLFVLWSGGILELYLYWYKERAPFDRMEMRQQLLDRLNQITGINVQQSDFAKRPSIPLRVFREKADLEKLLDVFEWMVEMFRAEAMKND